MIKLFEVAVETPSGYTMNVLTAAVNAETAETDVLKMVRDIKNTADYPIQKITEVKIVK